MDSIADGTPQSVTQITDHLAELQERVNAALTQSGRSYDGILIVAVSKKQPVELIEAAYRAGQTHFGENYVQEAVPKIQRLARLPLQWHFIGRIQANKTRAIAEHFQWVHTLDRLHVAERLNTQRPRHAPPLNVFIQVNLGGERRKAGVPAGEVESLARSIATLEKLRLRGLMTLPEVAGSAASTRGTFRALRVLQRELQAKGLPLDSLSMGMSADFELALQEGSTCIRIGTAVFGTRPA